MFGQLVEARPAVHSVLDGLDRHLPDGVPDLRLTGDLVRRDDLAPRGFKRVDDRLGVGLEPARPREQRTRLPPARQRRYLGDQGGRPFVNSMP
ncbi:hypothetical protein [Dactylosporangium sp. CS-033363]|uniref:hypothetical protein n=1 Tax=Dactylosporangium sp. CS-033363 TaxID=3239935 RepID=UPI003D91EA0E